MERDNEEWAALAAAGAGGAAGEGVGRSTHPDGDVVGQGFDLNLVRTFVVLYETLSVTRTADVLGVRQPSVSYALAKMRQYFGDRLFNREGRVLVPTQVARRLHAPLREAVLNLNEAFSLMRSFDWASSSAVFKVAMSDLGEVRFVPKVLDLLREEAPKVRLESVGLDRERALDHLLGGTVDAVFGSVSIDTDRADRHRLFSVDYAMLADPSNALMGESPTVADFEAARHVVVSGVYGHESPQAVVERLGLKRSIDVAVANFTALPLVVRGSDLVAVLPADIAAIFAADFGLRTAPMPFAVPPVTVSLYCLPDHLASDGQRWFADLVRRAVARAEG